MKYAIGLDLGGTNIKGLAVTPTGKVLAEHTTPTGDGEERRWVGNVGNVLVQLKTIVKCEPYVIGLAAPGLAAQDQGSIAFMPERLPGLEKLNWQKYFSLPRA